MTTARKDFMQADKIGTYHITARCVRRKKLGHPKFYKNKIKILPSRQKRYTQNSAK